MITDNKKALIEKYKELKILNNGTKPLRNDFLKFCNCHANQLKKIFGKDSYTKLQIEAGDDPNKLQLERTPLIQILESFGSLVRKHQRNVVIADWMEANYSPTADGIRVVHKIKWSELPQIFVENFGNKAEWVDVIKIIKGPNLTTRDISKTNKNFIEIVDRVNQWVPDRKRTIEEGYKIELRNYLEKYFNVEEEIGETNADLLLNKKYPIEIKKDPSQSEYDRLLGQMIRHNKLYGSAIAIITGVSSQDRFKKFQKLFIEIHNKLGMTAEILLK